MRDCQRLFSTAPMAILAGSLAGGIACATTIPLSPLVVTVIPGGLLTLLLVCRRLQPGYFAGLVIICFFLLGMQRYRDWQEHYLAAPWQRYLPLQCDSLLVEVSDVRSGRSISLTARLQKAVQADRRTLLYGIVQVYLPPQDSFQVLPGNRVWFTKVLLELPEPPRAPGQFDYRGYLRSRGIGAVIYIRDATAATILPDRRYLPLDRWFFQWRGVLAARLDAAFPAAGASLLKALLLGMSRELDAGLRDDFRRTGLMHLLAVSGLHVGMLLYMLRYILALLPLGQRMQTMLIILLLLFYLGITGLQPSVTRAVIMAVLWLCSTMLERTVASVQVLCCAAFLILLVAPYQLFWVGFQLSFCAVLAIQLCYQKLLAAIEKTASMRFKLQGRIAKNWLLAPLAVSIAAQLGTAPLAIWYFQQFSPLSLLLNLIVGPLAAVLLGGGMAFLILGELPWLGEVLQMGLSWIMGAQNALVHQAADWPGAWVEWRFRHAGPIVLFWAWLASASAIWSRSARAWLILLLLVASAWMVQDAIPRKPSMALIMLDVGQGDALLLRTPDGETALIDAGPANAYFDSAGKVLLPVLHKLQITRINRLFITHPHADHSGGLIGLLRHIVVDSVYLPSYGEGEETGLQMTGELCRRGVPVRLLRRGMQVDLGAAARFFVLGPSNSMMTDNAVSSPVNNRSLCLQLRYRNHSILLMGDAEHEAETALLPFGELLHSDVLKTGHHGSNTSSSPAFLQAVQPQIALISVGRRNRFKHPSPQILQRLRRQGSVIMRTDRQGSLWLELQQGEWIARRWY